MSDPSKSGKAHLYEHRAALVQSAERTQAGIDKTLVTLASAALGVSLVALKDIVKADATPQCTALLTAGWILLAACLGASLLSLAFSSKTIYSEIESVDRMIRNQEDRPLDRKQRSRWATATLWTNRFSLVAFFVGTVLVLSFAGANL
jgi:hypothetical protein